MKRAFHLFPLLLVIVMITGCSLNTQASVINNADDVSRSSLLQPVSSEHILKVRAAKMDFEKPGSSTMRNIELTLTEGDKNELLDWYNKIPENRTFTVDVIEGSVKLGVVVELPNDEELRIQYTSSGEVYVSVNANNKYRVDMPDIKPLFDKLLK